MRIKTAVRGLMLCVLEISVAGIKTPVSAGDCTIHWDSLQQHISGFGGSTAWAGGLADDLIDGLFSPTTGCGLTLVRMRIAPDGTTGAGEISIARKAQALGASIWAAPWSPPAAWKNNNNVNKGGSLLPSHYQDWADLLVSYVKDLQSQGIDLKWISAQNEPNWTADYESCRYTPEQLTTFIGEYLGPSLEKAGLKTRIIAPEVINWGSLKPFGDAILNSSSALKYCDVIASHSYGDEPKSPNYPYKLVIEKGKELWETEYGFDQFAGDESMTPGIAIAKQMHNQIVQGPVSAYHTWWIIPADGVNGTASNGLVMRGHIIQRGYVMGNYSRFVRPGSYRVATNNNPSTGIWATAYRNDSLELMTIVVINENNSAVEQKFVFKDVSLSSITPWETSDDVKLTARDPITSVTDFSWTLPAKSVVSFIGSFSTGPHLNIETIGRGSVINTPNGSSFKKGTSVIMTAEPQTGWEFDNWNYSGISDNQNPLTIIMDTSKSISAIFRRSAAEDGNLVLNGDFKSGDTNWILNVWSESAKGNVISEGYKIDIDSIGTNNHDIQLVQSGLFLEKEKTYVVKFDAFASSERALDVNIEMTDDPWTSYLQNTKQFKLNESRQTFSFKFTMNNATDVNGRIDFNVADSPQAVTIDKVSIKVFDPADASFSPKTTKNTSLKVTYEKSSLRTQFISPGNGITSLKLYNLMGIIIKSAELQTRSGETYSHSFDLANQSNGFYMVKIENEGNIVQMCKIIMKR